MNYPIYHFDLEQGTEEWLNIRKGKMTASHGQEIGNNGKGLETYIISLMAENYSSGEKVSYSNGDMERGNELEDQARSIYAINGGAEIKTVGFIEYSEFVGASPDGLVGEDGLIEIKCPNDVVYFQHLLKGADAIDSKYIWQIQMNLLISGRKWADYIAYNPNFTQSSFIHRIIPDEEMFKKLLVGFEIGEGRIKAIQKVINRSA